MKFTSMFFTASDSIFEIFLKGTNKRAKKKQRQGIFFIFTVFKAHVLDTNWQKMCNFAHLYYRKT